MTTEAQMGVIVEIRKRLSCFKTYDIRGKIGSEIDETIAYRIGRATAEYFGARLVVLGFDARETSPDLAKAISKGMCDSGVNVVDIGLVGTEEMYWAVTKFSADAGIEVTASHNPIDYNGMKIVKSGSQPLSEKDFSSIKFLAEANQFTKSDYHGSVFYKKQEARDAYVEKLMSFIDAKRLKPFKIVINSGNGVAGPVIDALDRAFEARSVKRDFVKIQHDPDSTFPNGIPNPLLKENRYVTAKIIKKEKADFGVAFDGDFDRCFFFDHLGHFIPGEYVVGLLAGVFLRREKGATIVHDPRVSLNVTDMVENLDGSASVSRTGHAFVKQAMRKADAIYGGEMSAHHYFRDFAYCDSGMVPWLLIWELLSRADLSLLDLISERRKLFPSSGEINFSVSSASNCLEVVKDLYAKNARAVDEMDGLSFSFKDWRFNIRKSNTEPLVRLNIETLGDEKLLEIKIQELTKAIQNV